MSAHFSIFLTVFMVKTAVAATPAMAETYWLSEPGLCDADDGEIEEMDAIYLTQSGIDSHYFSCKWPPKVGRAILRGEQWVAIDASCENATGAWQAELEIVQQSDGSIRVFQESGGISPVRFFRCD